MVTIPYVHLKTENETSFTRSDFWPLYGDEKEKAGSVVEQNRSAGVYDGPCVVIDMVTGKVW